MLSAEERIAKIDALKGAFQALTASEVENIEDLHRIIDDLAEDARTIASGPRGGSTSFAGSEKLTRRERQVARVIAQGNTSKQSAPLLGITPRTVETHRARIIRKLGAKNTPDLVRIVMMGPVAEAESAAESEPGPAAEAA